MKKFRKIMAVLVAAIMVVAMTVPAWAATSGRFGDVTGTITIENATKGEEYYIYRIFDLASFNDSSADSHSADEAYCYVIDSTGDWYSWLTAQGYAKTTTDITNPSEQLGANQLFWIDNNPVTIGTTTTYHIVTNTSNVSNTNDISSATYQTTDYSVSPYKALQDFAKAAIAYADPENATQVIEPTFTLPGPTSGTSVTQNNAPLGYYLVGTTTGTLCSLDTTNSDVTLYDKSKTPSITKAVKAKGSTDARDMTPSTGTYKYANDDTTWVEETTAYFGDTVYFRAIVTMNQGAKNYVVRDVMEEGFDLDPGTSGVVHNKIKLFEFNASKTYVKTLVEGAANDYVVDLSPTSECDFEITFNDSFLDTVKDGYTVEIEYEAKFTEDAYVFGDAAETASGGPTDIDHFGNGVADEINTDRNIDGKNTNSVILTYGENASTPWASAYVQTFQIDVVKTKSSSGTVYDTLGGAVFNIKDGGTTLKYMAVDANKNQYRIPNATEAATATITNLESKTAYEINVRGLAAGTYTIEEVTAPYGYYKLSHPVTLVINANGTIGVSTNGNVKISSNTTWNANLSDKDSDEVNDQYDLTSDNGGVHIINYTNQELPSTGGMGTTVLYIVGGMLVILAGAYLFFSRKKTA